MSANEQISVLVLMPDIGQKGQLKNLYELGIREACKRAKVQLVDNGPYDRSVFEKYKQRIEEADIVVAETSSLHPNVVFGIGYADTRRKPLGLLRNKTKIIKSSYLDTYNSIDMILTI